MKTKKEFLEFVNSYKETENGKGFEVYEESIIKTRYNNVMTYYKFDENDILKEDSIFAQGEFCREFLIGVASQIEKIIVEKNPRDVSEYITKYVDFYCDKIYKSMKQIEYREYKHIIYDFGNYKLFFILHKRNKYHDFAGFGCEEY